MHSRHKDIIFSAFIKYTVATFLRAVRAERAQPEADLNTHAVARAGGQRASARAKGRAARKAQRSMPGDIGGGVPACY